MASIDQIMITDLQVASPTDTVADAARRMREAHIGAVLVMEGDALRGIFTERDLLEKVVAEGKDPASTPVSQVQTPDPATVRSGTHVKECAAVIREGGFRHLPVVDGDGRAIGIVSSRVFLQYVYDALESFVDRAEYREKLLEDGLDPYEGVGGSYGSR